MEFSPALSREFRPYKPHPAPLLHICDTWDAHPTEVMMIGDSLRDDVRGISCEIFVLHSCGRPDIKKIDGSTVDGVSVPGAIRDY